jgi:acetylornithine deacetylase/succinyl-diaminopimelate desuccinylase family protein
VQVLPLLERLVSIDSVNPGLGGPGEGEIAAFVADWARDAGLDVVVEEVEPGRPNVVATARGSGGGRTLLLNGHFDTVGLGAMTEPLVPRVEDGRLYGRGSYDMKSGLAACLVATANAATLDLRGDVVVTAVVDEELASIGTEAVLRTVVPDAAIVAEPTDMKVAIAHKGFVAFEIETHGRAAHGSRPDLGVDAIAKMGHVLVGLEALDRALRERPPHPLLGTGSAHAGVVAGGLEYSTYPDRCLLQAERRMLPGEPVDEAESELQGLLDALGRDDADFRGVCRVVGARDAHEVDPGEEIVRLVTEHAGTPEPVGAHFWTDAGLIGAAGIPAILFGPGGEGAHAEVEWVSIEDAERCAAVFLAVAAEFCA